MSLLDQLRELPYFAGLPEVDLDRLCDTATEMEVAAGALLLEEGSPAEAMYVVISGEFEITQKVGDRSLVLGMTGPGEVLGEGALFEGGMRWATARAVVDATVAEVPASLFRELLASPQSALAMLHTVTSRLRAREETLRNAEKLAALGTLTAGLLHDLNNPAAAATRTADRLEELLSEERSLTRSLGEVPAGLSPPAGARPPAGALEQADREEEVTAWLSDQGVAAPWEVAPALVGAGWDPLALEEVAGAIEPFRRGAFLRLVAVRAEVAAATADLRMAAERISELVQAVKTYTYVDQAPVQDVDVHAGLNSTLVILRHKAQGTEVIKHLAADLPRVEGYGGELNQVWTNLIDNALDALAGGGEVTLRTQVEGDRVVVEVEDDGPGIPPDVQQRIFEPFFTTKPQGRGTGLGLHIAYSIVARHGGDITISSRPGQTRFRVTLPLRLPRRPGST